jgi:hypothetical protein
MKIHLSSKVQRCRGAALIMAVLLLVFVAIFLASYLFLAQGEYTSVARSQTWNASLVLAEAGVEDAFAFINKNVGQTGNITNWSATATADGWSTLINTASNQVFYLAARTPDTNLGYYSIYITNNPSGTNGPSILSIGTAYWSSNSGPKVGDSNVVVSFKGNTVRKVLVQTSGSSQVGSGVIAYAGMDFKGNNVAIDSFNSSQSNHSIWQTAWLYQGKPYGYWAPSLSLNSNVVPCRTANVTVATDGSIINVGNANIAGYAATAPGGTVSLNHNGSVGDLDWAYTHLGIQSGHSKDDMNKTFFSYSLPTPGSWLPVPAVSTNIGGVTYAYMITNRTGSSGLVYYAMNSLGSSIFINASNVVLFLTNGLSYSGGDVFTINTNADVQLWSTGDISTSGTAVINNYTKNAHALSIFDVSGHPINITFGGNGVGTGYIFAPSASLTFSGGGSSIYDVVGAIFCHDITINGHYNFHFDETLSQSATDQFIASMWQEVQ